MEEYTNLPEETEIVDDGSDLFLDGDDEPETEGVTVEEEEADAEGGEGGSEGSKTSEPEKPTGSQAQTITVKYNGETRELTVEEAVTLAQKGLDYDKVRGERDELRNGRANRIIGEYARENSMSVEQYLQFLEDGQKTKMLNREMDALSAKHPDAPEAVLREMAEMRIAAREKDAAAEAAEKKNREDSERQKPWADLLREFPEIRKAEDLPEDVLADIQSGLTPVDAMRRHQIKEKDREITELKAKLEAKEKNQTNKKRAIGSAASDAKTGEKDAFLMGLDGF